MAIFHRSYTPFKPSSLRVSIGPPSPPISPPATSSTFPRNNPGDNDDNGLVQDGIGVRASSTSLPLPPPVEPLPWLWQCHICRRTYAFNVTRRCLNDGHYFCSGTPTVKRGKTKMRACKSEFDYERWAAWQNWRRSLLLLGSSSSSSSASLLSSGTRNCWLHCSYPSECQWTRKWENDLEKLGKTIAPMVMNGGTTTDMTGTTAASDADAASATDSDDSYISEGDTEFPQEEEEEAAEEEEQDITNTTVTATTVVDPMELHHHHPIISVSSFPSSSAILLPAAADNT